MDRPSLQWPGPASGLSHPGPLQWSTLGPLGQGPAAPAARGQDDPRNWVEARPRQPLPYKGRGAPAPSALPGPPLLPYTTPRAGLARPRPRPAPSDPIALGKALISKAPPKLWKTYNPFAQIPEFSDPRVVNPQCPT